MQPLDQIDAATGDAVPWIDADTLTCLVAADPGEENSERQILSDEAAAGVFAAWERAQSDVHAKWAELSDWANLQPQIEKALRDAIDLVSEDGGYLGPEVQGDLVARLNGRWERAIVRAVRQIVRNEALSKSERVDALLAFVTETGLPVPEQPKPLPPARKNDIRVVCWMAVQPGGSETHG